MIRKTIFWLHLSAGVVAGLAVFIMSLTGVLLAFERQIKDWAASSHYATPAADAPLLTLEQLQAVQRELQPDLQPNAIVISSDNRVPLAFRAGRRGSLELDAYSGQPVQTASPALNGFFEEVEGFHRWLNVTGEHRAVARQINDVSNVIFLFLVLSGIYLWLPPLWKRAMVKARLWFRGDYPTSKSRDYHWHHIFGIWMALPLAVLVYTGMVISYPWAANLMYRAFGAEIPAAPAGPGGPPPGAGGPGAARPDGPGGARGEGGTLPAADAADAAQWLSLDALVQAAVADPDSSDWQRLTLTLPQASAKAVQIEIDQGNGTQAHKRHTLTLDRETGAITARRGFADQPEAQRLRGIARFLHTGEVLGLWGQIVAALASAAAVLLVWTGLSLAWRRLISPLFARKA